MRDYHAAGSADNLAAVFDDKGIRVESNGSLHIGAMTPLSEVATSQEVRSHCAALATAAEHAASPQMHEQETVSDELCQRPACAYYRNVDADCLKHGGDHCCAVDGENRHHAIYGHDSPCRMVSPTSLGVALLALDGMVCVRSPTGERTVPAAGFFRLPTAGDPFRETVLETGEAVSGVTIARLPGGWRSAYMQIPENTDSRRALVSAATSLNLGPHNVILDIRLALNAVAPVPWRLTKAEDYLRGKRADETNLREAARLALSDARPMRHNAYKIPIARALVTRVIQRAGGLHS